MRSRRASMLPLAFYGIGSVLLAVACSAGDATPSSKNGRTTGSGATGSGATGGDIGSGATGGPATMGSGGSSSGTGIVTAGGAAGAGGGPTVNPDAACIAEPRVGEQKPIDLFFMVDKSGSMNCGAGPGAPPCIGAPPPVPPTRWTSIADALNTFVGLPENAGTGVGIGFFPQLGGGGGSSVLCNVTDYNMPAVPIAQLPAVAPAVTMAISAQMPNGGTPTTPALSGALEYARAYATMRPERAVAVVFASDGEPQGCNSSINSAAAAARAAAAASPPVKTYVLGVGPSLNNLNQIAAAGGTGMAYLVESGGAADLVKALDAIRRSTLTCDYAIPRTDGGRLDFGSVNIETRVGSTGMMVKIPPVANVAACGPMGGWYYDNPTAPTRITLCPATCDPLITTAGSTMNVLIGCKTIPPIIE